MTQTDQKERTMPNAQTGEHVSSIAARFINLQPDTILAMAASDGSRERLARDIRALAASALRQDETKGVRKIGAMIKKVFGK